MRCYQCLGNDFLIVDSRFINQWNQLFLLYIWSELWIIIQVIAQVSNVVQSGLLIFFCYFFLNTIK